MSNLLNMGQVPATSNAPTQIEATRAVMEVQGAIVSAKQFPRDLVAVERRVQDAFRVRSLAEAGLYEYTRGGKVEGLSIRAAEALVNAYGNCEFGIRELEQKNGETVMQAFCHDYETNTRQTRLFVVKHVREKRGGSESLDSSRDIYENNANMGMRRVRACILGIVPMYLQEQAETIIKATLKTDKSPMEERVKKLKAAFESIEVDQEMIEAFLGNNLEAITENQLIKLGRVFNSIKDGVSSVEQHFKKVSNAADFLNKKGE